MAGELHRRTVGDYATLRRGTTYKGSLVGEPGPALLGLGSIEPGGGFRYGHYKTYGGDCPSELMLVPGDLYAALKGATKDGKMIGSVARVPSTVPSGRLTQDTVKLVFRSPDQDAASYLYWILRTPQYREYCAGHAVGSAVVALSRRDFLSYSVPPLTHERKQLVALLEALDNKIELNRRINETLEAIARAIFKSWFVDFDPVRAKTEGRDPGLPKEIADFFPDRFEDSELGEIPKGWRVMPAGEALTAVGGGTPSTKDPNYWDGGEYYWATPKDMSALSAPILLDTERKITEAGLAQISSGLLPAGTVLLSSRAPVGYLALAAVPTAINQGFIAMVCDGPVSNCYALNWCHLSMDEIKQRASGTTFAEISKAAFRPIPMMVPDERVMEQFTSYVRPFYENITGRLRESHTLATLRDALLPKLISGELRVGNAKRSVQEATT